MKTHDNHMSDEEIQTAVQERDELGMLDDELAEYYQRHQEVLYMLNSVDLSDATSKEALLAVIREAKKLLGTEGSE